MRTLHWLMCGAMTASALGCAPSAPPIPLADFSEELADAMCAKLFGCCDTLELNAVRAQLGEDEAACRRTLGTSPAARVEAGAQRYDADAAGRCIQRRSAYTCAEFSAAFGDGTLARDCSSALLGLRTESEPCEVLGDCVASTYCDLGAGAMQCRLRMADGERCDVSVRNICLEGALCVGAICVRLQPEGAACAGNDACTSSRCIEGRCAPAFPSCDGP